MSLAIDLTGSNLNINDKNSLHYVKGGQKTRYQLAIEAITSVIQNYDRDKKFPVYGFGAIVDNNVNHCFPLNGKSNPECVGIHGVMKCYMENITKYKFSGPTNFAPVIQKMIKLIKMEDKKKY